MFRELSAYSVIFTTIEKQISNLQDFMVACNITLLEMSAGNSIKLEVWVTARPQRQNHCSFQSLRYSSIPLLCTYTWTHTGFVWLLLAQVRLGAQSSETGN